MGKMKIIETGDYKELVPLFVSSGLEMHFEGKHPEAMITCWKADDGGSGPAGGVSVELKKGYFILGDIAVKEDLRKTGIGSELMKTAMERLRSLGAKEVYLVARAPKFFEKIGFYYMTPEEAPDIFNCKGCVQMGKTCFPRFMKFDCN